MSIAHADALRALRAEAESANRAGLAGAFLASIGEKPGFWRAPLCALAAAEAVPAHRYRAFSDQSPDCHECGLLARIEPAELDERGQILPGDLRTALAVLKRARELTPPTPDADAARRFERMLEVVAQLPPSAREGKLADAWRAEKLVVGNRTDVRLVIEMLGACGILQTPEHPGFTTRWTSFAARQARPSSRVECDPPIAFWTAAHGVDAGNVERWFGAHGVRASKSPEPRREAVAKASRGAEKRAKRAARSTELELGDVIAIDGGGTWGAAVVVDHRQDMGGRYPIVEMLDWNGTAPPSGAEVSGLRAAGARGMRYRVAIDLWVRDDPRGRWHVIASGAPMPDATHLLPSLGMHSLAFLDKAGRELAKLVASTRLR